MGAALYFWAISTFRHRTLMPFSARVWVAFASGLGRVPRKTITNSLESTMPVSVHSTAVSAVAAIAVLGLLAVGLRAGEQADRRFGGDDSY